MLITNVGQLHDVKTLAECLCSIETIEEEALFDCVPEPEMGILCDVLEKKGTIPSSTGLFLKADKIDAESNVIAVCEALHTKIDDTCPLYYYLWALGLISEGDKNKFNSIFDVISEMGCVANIPTDDAYDDGIWEDAYEEFSKDEIKNCEEWLVNPKTSPMRFSTYTSGGFSYSHSSPPTSSSTHIEKRGKATFKIQF